ncbi:hypothetical protein DAI22_10g040650 [Oryza sativa Japonica Group]|nr:hypothetical protein DAI22_10g040650 [Oryza sativa Japonica Group]
MNWPGITSFSLLGTLMHYHYNKQATIRKGIGEEDGQLQ